MNRYPVWKYILIAVALLLGALYTAPNYFGESPALQVTTGKTTVKITSDTTARVAEALKREGVPARQVSLEGRATRRPCARASPAPTPSSRPSWRSSAT
jgi:preprotein translocase subunit SecD